MSTAKAACVNNGYCTGDSYVLAEACAAVQYSCIEYT